jgi:hypothetical protein
MVAYGNKLKRMYATIDIDGKPYHRVTSITTHTRRPDVLVFWVDPQGLDDDLETPMDNPPPPASQTDGE